MCKIGAKFNGLQPLSSIAWQILRTNIHVLGWENFMPPSTELLWGHFKTKEKLINLCKNIYFCFHNTVNTSDRWFRDHQCVCVWGGKQNVTVVLCSMIVQLISEDILA